MFFGYELVPIEPLGESRFPTNDILSREKIRWGAIQAGEGKHLELFDTALVVCYTFSTRMM
jgi:hypothetical protein